MTTVRNARALVIAARTVAPRRPGCHVGRQTMERERMSGMELADFLLARIAEDEAVAEAATPGPWATQVMAPNRVYGDPPNGIHVCNTGNPMVGEEVIDDALHIARHDPARVLAECEAKRRIVNRLDGSESEDMPVLQLLALPYADHPDYREEWKP